MASADNGQSMVPLNVRVSGVDLDAPTRTWIAQRSQRRLGKFAGHIERVTVRLKDVNGPRGGVDHVCRVKVALRGLPSAVVEQQAGTAREAFDGASQSAARTVKRAVGKAATLDPSFSGKPTQPARARAGAASPQAARAPAQAAGKGAGSLIGRRVGRSEQNLRRAAARPEKARRDALVDTSLPGVSASDRKVGIRGTATRNTKLRRKGMTATLEDSATGKPSRKSTRRSENRAKSGTQLERRATRAVTSPKARARRARAGGGL